MAYLYKFNNSYHVKDLRLSMINDFCLDNGECLEIEIKLVDRRTITDKQRKFIFALCEDFSHYTGDSKEYIRILMQQYNATLRGLEIASLSNCDMTYANGLIDTIITFCIENEIPISGDILKEYEYKFTEKQTYSLILKRICIVCGRRADIHHIDRIGMGANRKKVSHIGKRVLPLCREHHGEFHSKGDELLIDKYHLSPVIIDEKLEYFIKKGNLKIYSEEEKK